MIDSITWLKLWSPLFKCFRLLYASSVTEMFLMVIADHLCTHTHVCK